MSDEGDFYEESNEVVHAELQGMRLSECAFYGVYATQSLQTMKVLGIANHHSVRILLDSGSTHNFIDSRLIKTLGWSLKTTKPFEVMIVDGGKIKSQGYCRCIPLEVGGYHCHTNLFALPLGAYDLVLGVQWLSTVSLVLWDFQLLTMEFQVGKDKFKLSHSTPPQLAVQEMSLYQLDTKFYQSNLGILLYSLKSNSRDTSTLRPHLLGLLSGDWLS